MICRPQFSLLVSGHFGVFIDLNKNDTDFSDCEENMSVSFGFKSNNLGKHQDILICSSIKIRKNHAHFVCRLLEKSVNGSLIKI